MAWTAPRTWVTSEFVTAALMNTHVRDNLSALWVYTTAGDIGYGTSSTALSRLGIGANRAHLQVNAAATAPEWFLGQVDVYNTDVDISNSSAENTMRQFSLPANSLYADSANRAIWGRAVGIYKNDSGSARTYTFKIKYGSTTLCTQVLTINADPGDRFLVVEYMIRGNGATNSQVGYLYADGKGTTAAEGALTLATATEDSTGALNVTLTCQMATAHASEYWKMRSHVAQLFRV